MSEGTGMLGGEPEVPKSHCASFEWKLNVNDCLLFPFLSFRASFLVTDMVVARHR